MKKITINKTFTIDCDNEMCRNCYFLPIPSGLKCKLFDIVLDHIVSSSVSDSGWLRCSECKNAEVKE